MQEVMNSWQISESVTSSFIQSFLFDSDHQIPNNSVVTCGTKAAQFQQGKKADVSFHSPAAALLPTHY